MTNQRTYRAISLCLLARCVCLRGGRGGRCTPDEGRFFSVSGFEKEREPNARQKERTGGSERPAREVILSTPIPQTTTPRLAGRPPAYIPNYTYPVSSSRDTREKFKFPP